MINALLEQFTRFYGPVAVAKGKWANVKSGSDPECHPICRWPSLRWASIAVDREYLPIFNVCSGARAWLELIRLTERSARCSN